MGTTAALIRCGCAGKLGVLRIEDGNQINSDPFTHDAIYNCRRCWACGKRFVYREIKGKFSSRHECGAKCLASKGPSCECSCAGKNHGRGYAS